MRHARPVRDWISTRQARGHLIGSQKSVCANMLRNLKDAGSQMLLDLFPVGVF